jgi:hypothetical protein
MMYTYIYIYICFNVGRKIKPLKHLLLLHFSEMKYQFHWNESPEVLGDCYVYFGMLSIKRIRMCMC